MDDGNRRAVSLFAGLPSRYETLAQVLGLGQYMRWRASLVRRVAERGPRRILDVATGPAGVALALASSTKAQIVGVDLSPAMLEQARRAIDRAPDPGRIRLCRAQAESLPFAAGSFDAVSFTYLLRYVRDPLATLKELSRVLAPGGAMVGLDFGVPPNPLWRVAWGVYTRIGLPVAGFLLGGRAWYDVGRFLGPSISDHCRHWPPERLAEAWSTAGMVEVGWRRLSLGGGLLVWGRKAA